MRYRYPCKKNHKIDFSESLYVMKMSIYPQYRGGLKDDMFLFVQNVCITNVFNAKYHADCEYENCFALQ